MKKTFLISALASLVIANTAMASKREDVAQFRLDNYSQDELAMEVHGMPYGDFLQGIVVREQFGQVEGAQIIYTGGEMSITQVCDSIQVGNWCVNLPASAAGVEVIQTPTGYLLTISGNNDNSRAVIIVPTDPSLPIETLPGQPGTPTQPQPVDVIIDPIDVVIDPVDPGFGTDPIEVIVEPIEPEFGIVPIADWMPTPEALAALNKWLDDNDDKNKQTTWDIVWNGEKLVWQNPETGEEKALRDSNRIQEAVKNTMETREARRDVRQDQRQQDRINDRIQPTPKEDLGEFDPKRGLDPRDKKGYEQLSELGWNQDRIQEMHDIFEKEGDYEDKSAAERNLAMQSLMQDIQQEVAAMPRKQQIQAFVALNNITASQGYDSVLDQLVNSWGLGNSEQQAKFNQFNDLTATEKKQKVKNAIVARVKDRERSNNRSKSDYSKAKNEAKKRGYDGSRVREHLANK
ncbi:hypothetical protein L4C33_07840 [Vibrio makurazakiensis]|uniref:hypothetical protein n=1 Tax=Vibrio makurazakiensis TaxID=2910250 RepID=UPI003D0C07EE